MYCGNTLTHAHTYIHTRLAYVRMYNSCTRVYAAGGRAADAMKKRFSSLTVSSYHCLPTFFSLSPYNISSPAGWLYSVVSLPPPYTNNSLENYEKGPSAASSAAPCYTIYTIRILIIPVPSVRNVADEYEIAGLQQPYVIRPSVGKVPRGRRRCRGVVRGWWVGGRPGASISVRRVENKFLGVPVSTRCGTRTRAPSPQGGWNGFTGCMDGGVGEVSRRRSNII